MKKEIYIDDVSGEPLMKPEDGFVIVGNIYDADGMGGLIGNAFPIADENGMINVSEINQYAITKERLLDALYYSEEDLKEYMKKKFRYFIIDVVDEKEHS